MGFVGNHGVFAEDLAGGDDGELAVGVGLSAFEDVEQAGKDDEEAAEVGVGFVDAVEDFAGLEVA